MRVLNSCSSDTTKKMYIQRISYNLPSLIHEYHAFIMMWLLLLMLDPIAEMIDVILYKINFKNCTYQHPNKKFVQYYDKIQKGWVKDVLYYNY